jgi:hypothetical protein
MSEIPEQWARPGELDELIQAFGNNALLHQKEDHRVALAIVDDVGQPLWVARNYSAAGNFLVAFDHKWPPRGPDWKAVQTFFQTNGHWWFPVSASAFILGSTLDLTELFTALTNSFPLTEQNILAFDLFTGEGLIWNSMDGVTVEVSPAKPDAS